MTATAAAAAPVLAPAPVLAAVPVALDLRIQKLLTGRLNGDEELWIAQCDGVCDAFDAYSAEPAHPPLDCTRWVTAERPTGGPASMECPTPLWAWLARVKWGPHGAAVERTERLWHVLMRCGCSSAAALGVTLSDGKTLWECAPDAVMPWLTAQPFMALTYAFGPRNRRPTAAGAAVAAAAAVVPAPGPAAAGAGDSPDAAAAAVVDAADAADTKHPPSPHAAAQPRAVTHRPRAAAAAAAVRATRECACTLCGMLRRGLDTAAVQVLARTDHSERVWLLGAPHSCLLRAARHQCAKAFSVLWCTLQRALTERPAVGRDVLCSLRPKFFERIVRLGHCGVWARITDPTTRVRVGGGSGSGNGNARSVPLCDVLLGRCAVDDGDYVGGGAAQEERVVQESALMHCSGGAADDMAAWLVPRLDARDLHAFDERNGMTRFMFAATEAHPRTVLALLRRAEQGDVDVLDRPAVLPLDAAGDPLALPYRALSRADVQFHATHTAVDLLPRNIPDAMAVAAAQLRAATDARRLALPFIAIAVANALLSPDSSCGVSSAAAAAPAAAGGDSGACGCLPAAAVRRCLAYAGLPVAGTAAAVPAPRPQQPAFAFPSLTLTSGVGAPVLPRDERKADLAAAPAHSSAAAAAGAAASAVADAPFAGFDFDLTNAIASAAAAALDDATAVTGASPHRRVIVRCGRGSYGGHVMMPYDGGRVPPGQYRDCGGAYVCDACGRRGVFAAEQLQPTWHCDMCCDYDLCNACAMLQVARAADAAAADDAAAGAAAAAAAADAEQPHTKKRRRDPDAAATPDAQPAAAAAVTAPIPRAAPAPPPVPVVTSATLVRDIQNLLLPQYFNGDADLWAKQCTTVCSAFDAYAADPSHVPPDSTRWVTAERPLWTPPNAAKRDGGDDKQRDGKDAKIDPAAVAEANATAAREFPSPLWAWIALVVRWPQLSHVCLERLFHVLMHCGCSSAQVLSETLADRTTTLLHHADTKLTAVKLLMAQPNTPIGPLRHTPKRYPFQMPGEDDSCGCTLCVLITAGYDSEALQVLARLDHFQRLALLSSPHKVLLRCVDRKCSDTFAALWATLHRAIVDEPKATLDLVLDLRDQRISGPSGHKWSLFTELSIWSDPGAWMCLVDRTTRLTLTPAGAAYLALPPSPYADANSVALTDLLFGGDQRTILMCAAVDGRRAWAIPRLTPEELNMYGPGGLTPLMRVAKHCGAQSLTALLKRAAAGDVDLMAQARAVRCSVVGADASLTAADLLPHALPDAMVEPAAELRAKTEARRRALRQIENAVTTALFLGRRDRSGHVSGAQFPIEVVRLCLAYGVWLSAPVLPRPEPICAERIQRLLLRQNFPTDDRDAAWAVECTRVCDAYEAYAADPSNPPLDCTKWVIAERPTPPPFDAHKQMQFPSPIWGWLSYALTINVQTAEEVKRLFHVLMHCGCSRVETLSESYGPLKSLFLCADRTPLALDLLYAQPNMPVTCRHPCEVDATRDPNICGCTLCTLLLYRRDDDVMRTLARMEHDERVRVCRAPHKLLLAAAVLECTRTTAALWGAVVRECATGEPDAVQALITDLRIQRIWNSGYEWSLYALLAGLPDDGPWQMLTDRTFRVRWTDPSTGMTALLPLADVLLGPNQRSAAAYCFGPHADARGAWLVPRLDGEDLDGHYNLECHTPLQRAAYHRHPRTLMALLKRAGLRPDEPADVDVLANPAIRRVDDSGHDVPMTPDFLTRPGATYDDNCTAADLLPADGGAAEPMQAAAQALRKAVAERREALMTVATCASGVLAPLLAGAGADRKSAGAVSECLQYAGLWPVERDAQQLQQAFLAVTSAAKPFPNPFAKGAAADALGSASASSVEFGFDISGREITAADLIALASTTLGLSADSGAANAAAGTVGAAQFAFDTSAAALDDAVQPRGTAHIAFSATHFNPAGDDPEQQQYLQSITAMPVVAAHGNRSFEELRYDDLCGDTAYAALTAALGPGAAAATVTAAASSAPTDRGGCGGGGMHGDDVVSTVMEYAAFVPRSDGRPSRFFPRPRDPKDVAAAGFGAVQGFGFAVTVAAGPTVAAAAAAAAAEGARDPLSLSALSSSSSSLPPVPTPALSFAPVRRRSDNALDSWDGGAGIREWLNADTTAQSTAHAGFAAVTAATVSLTSGPGGGADPFGAGADTTARAPDGTTGVRESDGGQRALSRSALRVAMSLLPAGDDDAERDGVEAKRQDTKHVAVQAIAEAEAGAAAASAPNVGFEFGAFAGFATPATAATDGGSAAARPPRAAGDASEPDAFAALFTTAADPFGVGVTGAAAAFAGTAADGAGMFGLQGSAGAPVPAAPPVPPFGVSFGFDALPPPELSSAAVAVSAATIAGAPANGSVSLLAMADAGFGFTAASSGGGATAATVAGTDFDGTGFVGAVAVGLSFGAPEPTIGTRHVVFRPTYHDPTPLGSVDSEARRQNEQWLQSITAMAQDVLRWGDRSFEELRYEDLTCTAAYEQLMEVVGGGTAHSGIPALCLQYAAMKQVQPDGPKTEAKELPVPAAADFGAGSFGAVGFGFGAVPSGAAAAPNPFPGSAAAPPQQQHATAATAAAAAAVPTAAAAPASPPVLHAWDIQALLVPAAYDGASDAWDSACDKVCDAFDAYEADPRNPPLDCTRWSGSTTAVPAWAAGTTAAAPTTVAVDTRADCPTPIWGWLSLATPAALELRGPAYLARLERLFHVLMHCGCSRAATLSETLADGKTLLDCGAGAARIAELLIAQPHFPITVVHRPAPVSDTETTGPRATAAATAAELKGVAAAAMRAQARAHADAAAGDDVCACSVCAVMAHGHDRKAVQVLARTNRTERVRAIASPHALLLRAALRGCVQTYNVLWDELQWVCAHHPADADRLASDLHSQQVHRQLALRQRKVPLTADFPFASLHTLVARFNDGGGALRALTDPTTRIMRHVGRRVVPVDAATGTTRTEDVCRSVPLSDVLLVMSERDVAFAVCVGPDSNASAAAWLVSHLAAGGIDERRDPTGMLALLDTRDRNGHTPLMRACAECQPPLIEALLRHAPSGVVDVLAHPALLPAHLKYDDEPAFPLARYYTASDVTFDTTKTALDLLPRADAAPVARAAALLRAAVYARRCALPLISAVATETLRWRPDTGSASGSAQLPNECIRLCLEYGALPVVV